MFVRSMCRRYTVCWQYCTWLSAVAFLLGSGSAQEFRLIVLVFLASKFRGLFRLALLQYRVHASDFRLLRARRWTETMLSLPNLLFLL